MEIIITTIAVVWIVIGVVLYKGMSDGLPDDGRLLTKIWQYVKIVLGWPIVIIAAMLWNK